MYAGFAFFAAVSGYNYWRTGSICGADDYPTPVTGTPWVIHDLVTSCSAVDGSTIVVAQNTRTGEKIEIAHVGNAHYPDIKVDSPRRIELIFDSDAEVISRRGFFAGIEVR